MRQNKHLMRVLGLLLYLIMIADGYAQHAMDGSPDEIIIDLVVKESPRNSGSLELNWYAPERLKDFIIRYGEAGGQIHEIAVSGQRQFQLEKIDSGKDYAISVIAIDESKQKTATSPTTNWLSENSRQQLELAQSKPSHSPATAAATLNLTMRALASNNFPFIYTTVAADMDGAPIGNLTQANFTAFEDGRLQTDFFEVTLPKEGGLLDFIFLIDNSGSMAEEHQQVKDNVKVFVDSLVARHIDLRLGLVRFGQSASGGQPILVNNAVMTDNVTLFKTWLDQMTTDGGIEPGLLAVERAATQYSFRTGSQRHFLLITDEESNGGGTLSQAISACLNNDVTVHTAVDCNWLTSNIHYCNATSIRGTTNGLQFDVIGPYRDILDVLTGIIGNAYIVRYRTDNPVFDGIQREVRIEVDAFNQSDFVIGYYTPGAAPKIVRTPATINLSNTAQVAGINLTIAAEITDPIAPFVQSATLFYRKTGDPSYTSKPMTSGAGNIYSAVIFGSSVQTPGIDYYITATDGQVTSSDPAVDPSTVPYQIAVLPNQPPQITHTPVTEAPLNDAIPITAGITDNTNFLSGVTLYYRRFGALLFSNLIMNFAGGSTYEATIPSGVMTEDGVEYYIRAIDNFGVASVHGIHFIKPKPIIPPCGTPFTDNFNDGNANGWRPKTPSLWHVNPINGNNAYCLDVLDLAGSEYTVMETCSWDNFELTLRGRSTAADNKNFFILFGAPDPNNATFNGYYLQFAVGGVRLFRTIDGAGVVIGSHPQDFASDNNFHQITVRREGANLKAFGDGLLLVDLNDTVFPSGVIGFGSFKSTACFDDVNISFGDCPGGNTFSDDFNDGNANGWTPLTPSRWQVSSNAGSLRYFLNTTNYNSPDEKRLGELSIINSQTWNDFIFECDARSEDAASGNSGADLSIVFGYQDFDSYYYVNYNRESGFTEMHRIHDGGPRVTLATYNAPTFNDGNYHKLRIERQGSSIHAYFDGALILSGNDSFFGQGQIGVGSFNDSGYFDNIEVRACSGPPLPNLTGTALAFSPATFCPGDAITITGAVANNGAGDANNEIRVNFFLTDDPTQPDFNLFVHTFAISSLSAGQSYSFNETGTIPSNAAPGNYYLWMNVDVDDKNLESNEGDNGSRTGAQLTVRSSSFCTPDTIKPVVSNPVTNCAEYIVDIRVENVTNLFGVSFVLNYTNTAYVNYVTSENGVFLGNDVLLYANPEDPLGKVSIGVTRKTGQPGSTGSGVIVRVKFSSPASTPVGTPVTFSITDIVGIDPLNNSISLTPQTANTVLNCGIAVWPGDTNNDGIVNQADVLPLGLHWNRTGPARSGGSCAWGAQFAVSWTPSAATYADANGDGIVNQADVLCIGLNWGRTHTTTSSAPLELADNALAKTAFAEVFAEAIPAQLAPGQEFILKIQAAEARNLFGLAFELQNDRPELLQILSVEPEALFGHEALLYSHLEESGNSGIGITRKNGQPGAQGAGAVIRLKGKISSAARLGEVITLTLNDIVAQNHEGHVGALPSSLLQLVVGAGANVALQRNSRTVTEYQLYQNYPNPFNPETMIAYDILEAGHVTLRLFNTVGQEVRTLIDEMQSPGAYQVHWDGRNTLGQVLPSGIYFYRLQAGEFVQIRKMTLVQ